LLGAIVVLSGLAGPIPQAYAATRYVAPNGVDSGTCNNPNAPCRTLQYAIDQSALSGDIILVRQGTYDQLNGYDGHNQVAHVARTISILGGYSPNWSVRDWNLYPTVVSGGGSGRAFYITGGALGVNAPLIEGFIIRDGDSGTGSGGGIYCQNARPNLRYLTITGNESFLDGGGVYLDECAANITNNTIFGNTSRRHGGGIGGHYYQAASPLDVIITDNVIVSNSAGGSGGGIGLHNFTGDVFINRNKLRGNYATGTYSDSNVGDGGGAWLFGFNALDFLQNEVRGNTTKNLGGGLYWQGTSPARFHNNAFVANVSQLAGVWLTGGFSNVELTHNTVSHNTDRGVFVSGQTHLNVWNSIFANETVGIEVGQDASAYVSHPLWWNNGSNTGGTGSITLGVQHTGNPLFWVDGFHITLGSAAIDQAQGIAVAVDIDVQSRTVPLDIGADELGELPSLENIYLPIVLKNHQ
jgi:hypothetical protein